MKSAEAWFAQYGESHQNPTNKAIHWLCIPVIFVSTLGLLLAVKIPGIPVTLAHIAIALGMVFYFRLGRAFGLWMGAFTLVTMLGLQTAKHMGLPYVEGCITAFVVAWVLQFVGHKIEGKKPSFFEDLQFLLVGPAWLLNHILERVSPPR